MPKTGVCRQDEFLSRCSQRKRKASDDNPSIGIILYTKEKTGDRRIAHVQKKKGGT